MDYQFKSLLEGSPEVNLFNFSVLSVAVFFGLYWFLGQNEKLLAKIGGSDRSSVTWTVRRVAGFVLMGVVPLIFMLSFDFMSLSESGINTEWHPDTWIWLAVTSALVILISYSTGKKPDNLAQYPQIRNKEWNNTTLFAEYGGWFVYLLGYEFLFRGILFLGTVPLLGVSAAIALNAAIYSISHIPKGGNETIGALILGLVICYFTWLSGSIWFAFILHVVMAWSNSFLLFISP